MDGGKLAGSDVFLALDLGLFGETGQDGGFMSVNGIRKIRGQQGSSFTAEVRTEDGKIKPFEFAYRSIFLCC